MVSALDGTFMIIINTEFMIGILGNGFIALVNLTDWIKKRKISSADRILTALAISRIFLILIMMMNWFTKGVNPVFQMKEKVVIFISTAWTVANHFSIWLGTCLSLFYFFKVANFSNPLFLYLKRRVDGVILITLLGSLILLPCILIMTNLYFNNCLCPYGGNMTLNSKASGTENFSKLILFTVGSFIPFSISLTFLLLLIFSLWKHLKMMKTMKNNVTGLGDPKIKAPLGAMKAVISFLLLFAVYFLIIVIIVFHFNLMQKSLVLMLTIANAYPSVHSLILILGNSKLRRVSLSVLRQLK